jgi:hypothetical protein
MSFADPRHTGTSEEYTCKLTAAHANVRGRKQFIVNRSAKARGFHS